MSESFKNSLSLDIKPSGFLLGIWLLAHLVAGAAIATVPVPWGWRVPALLVLLWHGWRELQGLPGSGRHGAVAVRVRSADAVEVHCRDGRTHLGRLCGARSYPGLVVLELAGTGRLRRLPLCRDAVPADRLRRLRAVLNQHRRQE